MKIKDCMSESICGWYTGSEILPIVVDKNTTIIGISSDIIHLSDHFGHLHIKPDYKNYKNKILELAINGITVNEFYDKEIQI